MRRIKRSQEDINILQEIDTLGVNPSSLVGFDFSDMGVVKPWGYEYLAFESPDQSICAWVLHMKNNGQGTSLHCHRNKETRIIVLEGEIRLRTVTQEIVLSWNEEMLIDRAAFHSLSALTDPCVVLEIESPSNKPDAIRWKDLWGRERQEYEAQCELVPINRMFCPYKSDPELNKQISTISLETLMLFDS